jgi:hypothetical protein
LDQNRIVLWLNRTVLVPGRFPVFNFNFNATWYDFVSSPNVGFGSFSSAVFLLFLLLLVVVVLLLLFQFATL